MDSLFLYLVFLAGVIAGLIISTLIMVGKINDLQAENYRLRKAK